MTDEMNPVLYILMRKDIHSLAGGKGMAQAAHAANQFLHWHDVEDALVEFWKNQTSGGFGTTVVLGVENEATLKIYIEDAIAASGCIAGLVHDPTFPIRDGEAILTAPVDTCGYIFGDKLGEIVLSSGESLLLADYLYLLDLYPTLNISEM
jgi:peptidyl-tRNA hydrolase